MLTLRSPSGQKVLNTTYLSSTLKAPKVIPRSKKNSCTSATTLNPSVVSS